jgi:hypothetical protein
MRHYQMHDCRGAATCQHFSLFATREPGKKKIVRHVVASAPTRHFCQLFSATTGDRSRATHARSHPSSLARSHILAAKPRAAAKPRGLRNNGAPMELRRQAPAPRRLAVLYKPGLHRQAVPRRPVGAPALRTPRQVVPVLRCHRPMRSPLKIPKRLLRERELYSSLISLIALVLYGCRARHIQRGLSKLVRDVQWDLG